MKANVGTTDKGARVIIALVIIGIGIYFKSLWGLMALLPLLSSAASFCPLYKIFGFNTYTRKSVQ